MTAYYNEFDPYAAQWLRNLIAGGHIAPGDVDERSIVDVRADDLKAYTQVHFFAGIGGWSHALRLAMWPDDRPVWTGSCPCQPFSAAGKQKGAADERHLWPVFHRLIAQCGPAVVFGEQVASRLGRDWLAGVRADLEALGYAVGAADLCAAGVGAPHIRQRLFWAADAERWAAERHGHEVAGEAGGQQGAARDQRLWADAENGSDTGRLADRHGGRQQELAQRDGEQDAGVEASRRHDAVGCGDAGRLADTISERRRIGPAGSSDAAHAGGAGQDGWGSYVIRCADGKSRRIEPSIQPLAHGVPGRVGRLRAYGNAIVPQVAAAFIRASGV